MLAEYAAEMREVVKAPGEGDFADMAVREHRRGEIVLALRQALGEHVTLERGLFVREKIVDIARRDTERGRRLR